MCELVGLIFKQLLIPVYADFRSTIHPVRHEVSSLKELVADYLMQTGIFIPSGLSFPKVLSGAELSKVLCGLGADIFEEFEGDSSYLLLVGVQIEEDNRIVLVAYDSCHLL
jgi:hypothetical protein